MVENEKLLTFLFIHFNQPNASVQPKKKWPKAMGQGMHEMHVPLCGRLATCDNMWGHTTGMVAHTTALMVYVLAN